MWVCAVCGCVVCVVCFGVLLVFCWLCVVCVGVCVAHTLNIMVYLYIGKVRTKEGPVYVEVGWVCTVFLIKVFFFLFGFLFPAGLEPHLMAVRLGRRLSQPQLNAEDNV